MNIGSLRAFTNSLRTEGAWLRHRGLSELADVLDSVATDHEKVLDAWYTEELTLHEAAEESGFQYSTLQQMKTVHVGAPGSPRIRRCDLPSKPRGNGPKAVEGNPDLADEILASRVRGE